MGLTLEGWIEVKNPYREQWDGVVKIGIPLTGGGRNMDMYKDFFYDTDAIVGCRGLPEILSPEVEDEKSNILAANFCQSWLTWDEMLLINWNVMTHDWQLLYDLMELLTKSHGEKNVRMVIWFY